MKRLALLILTLATLAAAPLNNKPAPATGPATAPAINADNLYRQIIKDYLAAEWTNLETTLTQKSRELELKSLSKDQQADIAYIQKSLAECHPAWLAQTKQNKKIAIRPTLWAKTLPVTFDPSISGNVQVQSSSTQMSFSVNWPVSDLDSTVHAEHGFTKGDLANLGVWQALETANVWSTLSFDKVAKLTPADRATLQRYQEFRGSLAGAYYGTPRSRRWTIYLALDAHFGSHTTSPTFIPRRPLAALIVAEIAAHPQKYPSLHLAPANDITEPKLATSLMPQFERTILTLAEDKSLRDAIKDFATPNSNAVYTSGKATLPNKEAIALDPAIDAPLAERRNQWLKATLTPTQSP